MAITQKHYAELVWDNYRNDGDVPEKHEIRNIDEAVAYATSRKAAFFRTFVIESIDTGSKTYTSEPGNFSGRHYVDADLYTPLQVISDIRGKDATKEMRALASRLEQSGMVKEAGELLAAFNDKNPPIVQQALKDPAGTMYVRLPYKGFTRLEQGDAAYDSKGQRVWPPAPPLALPPKPGDRYKLK